MHLENHGHDHATQPQRRYNIKHNSTLERFEGNICGVLVINLDWVEKGHMLACHRYEEDEELA